MKILITTDWYGQVINGVVESVMNLKEELIQRGHEVKILTLSSSMDSYEQDDVIYIGSIRAGIIYPQARVRTGIARKYIKNLIDWKPDIVHSQCEFSTFHFGRKIAKKLGIPLVHTYHTVYENYTHYFCPSKRLGKRIVSVFSRRVLNKTNCVVAPSGKVADILKDYQVATDVKVIPTGIKFEKFSFAPDEKWIHEQKLRWDIPQDSFVVAYVGRLAKEKNLQEIITFLPKLSAENIILLIVGDGPFRSNIEKLVLAKHLKEQVRFTGMVPSQEVGKYYYLGDLFVNASTSETQGLTYFEALAAGRPILCRKDRCLDGVVEDGKNGWQYESMEEFVQNVQVLMADEVLQKEMSTAASQTAERFSTTVFADGIEDLYKSLLECC